MQILDIKLQSHRVTEDHIGPNVVSLPKGTIKTGLRARFAVSVIVAGEVTIYPSVRDSWEALGFAKDYYGFGSRLQIAVARDGLAVVEHLGTIYTFARASA